MTMDKINAEIMQQKLYLMKDTIKKHKMRLLLTSGPWHSTKQRGCVRV